MKTWKKCNAKVFWGEVAPNDHVVQIYDDDNQILDTLEDFIITGINAEDSVIIIATESHLSSFAKKLESKEYNLNYLESENRYIPLNAQTTLYKFMSVGWPNEGLFKNMISEIILRAKGPNRKVRVYAEMGAILWSQGYNGATIELEYLWQKLSQTEAFCLFCAYPKSGFTHDIEESIDHVCSMHSKIIAKENKIKAEIIFRSADLGSLKI